MSLFFWIVFLIKNNPILTDESTMIAVNGNKGIYIIYDKII